MADGDNSQIPKSICLGVRIYGCDPKNSSELRQVKVFKRTTVAHVAKTVTCLFPKSGYRAKDFDVFLVRPPQEDVQLSPVKTLADYEIQNNELIEFRVRSIPITVCVNLYDGEVRQLEVNSALCVADVVEIICQKIGIKHGYELSLAFPDSQSTRSENSMKVNWLDPTCSLNNQGISDEDTLLLRKKFFVRNEDIVEAIGKKGVLLQLLYNQLRHFYTTQIALSTPVQVSSASALLLHVEQGDQSARDVKVARKVLPKGLHNDSTVHSQVVEAYQREKVFLLQECEAKCQFITMFLHPHMSTAFFPVQLALGGEWHEVVISSKALSICIEGVTQLKTVEQWKLDQLRKWEATPDKFKFKVDGKQVVVYTPHGNQIANYLHEMLSLIFTHNSQLVLPALSPVDIVPTAGPKRPQEAPIKTETAALSDSQSLEIQRQITAQAPLDRTEKQGESESVVESSLSSSAEITDQSISEQAGEHDGYSVSNGEESDNSVQHNSMKGQTNIPTRLIPIIAISNFDSEQSHTRDTDTTSIDGSNEITPTTQEESYDTAEEDVAPPIEEQINLGESESSETSFDDAEQVARESDKESPSEHIDAVNSLTAGAPMAQEENYDTTEEVTPPIEEQINLGESESSETSFDDTEQVARESDKESPSEHRDAVSSLTTYTPEVVIQEQLPSPEIAILEDVAEYVQEAEDENHPSFPLDDSGYIEAMEKNLFDPQAFTNSTLLQTAEEDSPSEDYRDIEIDSEAPSTFQQQDVITSGIVHDTNQAPVQDQIEPVSSDQHFMEVHKKLEVLSSQMQHQEQLLEQVRALLKDDFHPSKPDIQVGVAAQEKRFITYALYLLFCIIMLNIFLVMSHFLKVKEPAIHPF